ncbi:MAG: FAD-dependent oxidoreductase [Actinobacteria bacterium]|nr:FAD-dependent oxidoreductase [Actinomycetota bacterium]MBW3649403.1 FAD-dependent oxidoreductase [Actinomycetota bacterium]
MAAARAGVRRGKRTLLVQDGPVGGDCTFTGCVPSKALIAAAGAGAGFSEAMASAARAVKIIAAGEEAEVFRREGVEVLEGRARFRSRNEIDVDGQAVGADRFVVATGAAPAVPPIPGLRELDHLTSDNVWDLQECPATLAVLGGGAIGCELAQAFARLGARVTVIEALDHLLSKEEPEVATVMEGVLRREGVEVRAGQKVVRVEALGSATGATATAARIHVEGGEPVEVERVLVAIGRRPVTDGLDPAAAGVELDQRGFVETDDYLQTSAPNIWAVGDVAGKLQFTHAADEMGRIAVGNAFGSFRKRRFHAERIPWVTFTDPEVARVGLSEQEAAARGGQVAFLPLSEVDRAVAEDRTDGFLKVIVGPRWPTGNLAGGRVLGATLVAPRAGELIHEFALAIRTGIFPAHLALTVHAYPTWSMAVQKVMGQFFVEVEGRRARPAGAGG